MLCTPAACQGEGERLFSEHSTGLLDRITDRTLKAAEGQVSWPVDLMLYNNTQQEPAARAVLWAPLRHRFHSPWFSVKMCLRGQ